MAGLRLPTSILAVEQAPRLAAAGLQDKIRPIGYGIQISKGNPGEFGECSTGFHVYKKNDSGWIDPALGYFFLTASHCSIERGVVDGSVWGQPYISDPIGSEVDDSYRFNTGPDCPYGGVYCQWSDVTVMQLNPGIDITTAAAKSTSVLPPTNPPFNGWQGVFASTATYGSVLGEPVVKTGRSTGQTSGKVTKSCYNAPYGGYWTLCMQESDMRVRPGDSGAAVWVPYAASQAMYTPHPAGIVVAWNQQTGSGDRSYLSPIARAFSSLGDRYNFY